MNYNRGNQQRKNPGGGQTPQQMWLSFLEKLQKDKNPLYELLKDSQLEETENLTVKVATEEVQKQAKSKVPNITAKLFTQYPQWKQKKLFFTVGNLSQLEPNSTQQTTPRNTATIQSRTQSTSQTATARQQKLTSPLQALNHILFSFQETPQSALKQAEAADDTCESLYQQLTKKTEYLATEIIKVKFPWRVRVGGTRGFRELLLPAFHPVYGVPYVASSSLKGAVLAWARQNKKTEIDRLLGKLEDGIGTVQFLDAFPTGPCLSIDMANPHWHWENDDVKYKPEPHALLSMESPELAIGLALTSRGNDSNDVKTVKEWLEQALAVSGIGSRVSSGYGRTTLTGVNQAVSNKSYQFQLWTAGMYGSNPPSQGNNYQGTPEFRPTAVRGMLRYWFRAIALGIYPPQECKTLEAELFGTIEPSSKEGSIRISVEWKETPGDRTTPYHYTGKILLEAKENNHLEENEQNHLILMEKVLLLASHLGGIGRGSRRPLHWNNPHPGLRGCHWELETNRLSYDRQTWQDFLQEVITAFTTVQPRTGNPAACSPGTPGNRNQDVLNSESKIYLVSCRGLQHPKQVKDWRTEGTESEVRGEALDLLYDNRFKGVNPQGQGNAKVGGQIDKNGGGSTPSYVVIQSNFPEGKTPYQAVTIFGANQRDRAQFVQALPTGSIQVWPLPQA